MCPPQEAGRGESGVPPWGGGGGGGGLVCFPWRRGSGVPSLPNVILIVIMTEHACLGRTEGQLSQVIASHPLLNKYWKHGQCMLTGAYARK